MSLFYISLGKRRCFQLNYDMSLIIAIYSDFRDVKMWQKCVNYNQWNTGSKWPLRKSPGWGQLWNAWLSLGLSSQWDCWLRIWRTQLPCKCIFKHLDPGGKMLTPGTEAVGKDNTIRDSASSLISEQTGLWNHFRHIRYSLLSILPVPVVEFFPQSICSCDANIYSVLGTMLLTCIKSFNVHRTPIWWWPS